MLPAGDVTAYFASGRAAPASAPTPRTSRGWWPRATSSTRRTPRRRQAFPDDVPVPEEWGGYRVRPEVVEFWQGRPGRMHDRLVYRRTGPDLEAWRTERLAP